MLKSRDGGTIIILYAFNLICRGIKSSHNYLVDTLKAVFGEFALIDSKVVPVREIMQKYDWTETALHHHMLGETPMILFLHCAVNGDADELIRQATEMTTQTSTYQNLSQSSKTHTSAGPLFLNLFSFLNF